MKINISIEARMTSTRLPGKTLKLIHGKPALEIMIDRIRKVKSVDNIIFFVYCRCDDDIIN